MMDHPGASRTLGAGGSRPNRYRPELAAACELPYVDLWNRFPTR
jgi:hypothetical protein